MGAQEGELLFGGGGAQEVRDLFLGLVAAGRAEHGDQDGEAERAPICCIVLSSPDAAPDSRSGTLDRAISVSETNCRPMPVAKTSIGPRMLPGYVESTSIRVSQASPAAQHRAPVTMKGLGPNLGSSCEVTPAPPRSSR